MEFYEVDVFKKFLSNVVGSQDNMQAHSKYSLQVLRALKACTKKRKLDEQQPKDMVNPESATIPTDDMTILCQEPKVVKL